MNRSIIRIAIDALLITCLTAMSFLVSSASIAQESDSAFAIPATDAGLPGAGTIRRMEWFQNLWIARRTSWAASLAADQGAVVFLGDSITQGWGEGLAAAFPKYKVANRGISGDTSRGVLIRLEKDVLAVNPKAIVLLIGTNDLEEQVSPAVVAGNVELIVDKIRSRFPEIPIVINEVFPSATSMRRPTQQIQKINALYRDLLPQYEQVTLLETFALFDDGQGDAMPDLFPDLLHLNEAGYAVWADALRSALDAVLN